MRVGVIGCLESSVIVLLSPLIELFWVVDVPVLFALVFWVDTPKEPFIGLVTDAGVALLFWNVFDDGAGVEDTIVCPLIKRLSVFSENLKFLNCKRLNKFKSII